MKTNPADQEILPESAMIMHKYVHIQNCDYQDSLKYLLRNKIYSSVDLQAETEDEYMKREKLQESK